MQSDHDCCPCVARLRQQNHAAASAADQRAKGWQSELVKLRALMAEATTLNRGWIGLSAYGQAALAAALDQADNLTAQLMAEQEENRNLRRRLRKLTRDTALSDGQPEAQRSSIGPGSIVQSDDHMSGPSATG